MPASANIRHAVSRSIGATTWTRKEGEVRTTDLPVTGTTVTSS